MMILGKIYNERKGVILSFHFQHRQYNTNDMELQDTILTDKKRNGKERPWKERKDQSLNVSEVLKWGDAYEKVAQGYAQTFKEARENYVQYRELIGWLGGKSEKLYDCGSTLEFAIDAEGNKRLFRAWFCKDRLCPMCNWRRSIKLREQMLKILQTMKDRNIQGRPIFATFTMQNVKGEDISKSFSDFATAFHRLMDYKDVKAVVLGAVRSSEITYNKKRKDYNTHIHCLIWVTPDYFAGRNYISQAKWTALWKRAAKLDYTPVVNVKTVKPETPTEADPTGYIKAVLEITKYTAKPTTIPCLNGMTHNMTDKQKLEAGKRISALERGMYRKRLISFFGIFKELHKELNLDDIEDGDLIGADEAAEGSAVEAARFEYDYIRHDYYQTGHGSIKNGDTHYEEDD